MVRGMSLRNSPERYGAVAQILHWIVVALVVVQYALGLQAADLPAGLERLKLLATHKSIGMTVLALAVLRLAWRGYDRPPTLRDTLPAWQRHAARATHALLYALLFAVPLAGWAASSAANHPVAWFGLFAVPGLVAPDPALKDAFVGLHHDLNRLLLATALLHAAAALHHHFVLRDDVLRRMLPRLRRPTAAPKRAP
jgi:cytochrome b561